MELIRDTVDFSAYMEEPKQEHRILPASNWQQEVIDHFYKPRVTSRVVLGWKKTQQDFEFRDGEVSLWGGINGHGKSLLHSQVTLDLMMQGETVCIASFEMRPYKIMTRMLKQASGSQLPTRTFAEAFHNWTDGKLWLYDQFGTSNPKTMLAVIRYAVDKFKVRHFVIDNLAKVIAGEDDYNAQKDFVNGLCAIAKDTGTHIHLIAHMRKGRTEDDVPGKFDIKGAGAITDLVDNVFIVWRNKGKEEKARSGADFDPNHADAILRLEKQRNSEGDASEGCYGLFFDPVSNQFRENRHALPSAYNLATEESAMEQTSKFALSAGGASTLLS
jgi:twinkle protein